MFQGSASLGGDVLVQGTAQRHVNELNAATDAQNREPALPGHREERQLE
jgi:hypothetical protein